MAGFSERRGSTRFPVEPIAWIAWKDADGEKRHLRGQCLDVSDGGVRMRANRSVPQGIQVSIGVPIRNVTRQGTVRHCARAGGWYRIGIEYDR